MSFKKKFNEVKDSVFQTVKERPLESIAVLSAGLIAGTKIINAITDARNSNTWKREVERREQNQKN